MEMNNDVKKLGQLNQVGQGFWIYGIFILKFGY